MINTWKKMCKPLNQNLKEKNIFDVIYWPLIVTLLTAASTRGNYTCEARKLVKYIHRL